MKEETATWNLIGRIKGDVRKTVKAKELWEQIGYAAWASADPGLQFHTTINDWHTCLADGEIIASNPCSEYMFLDNTACNLASINLLQFLQQDGNFAVEEFETYRPFVDHGSGNLGSDGPVPRLRKSQSGLISIGPLVWAMPTSAVC